VPYFANHQLATLRDWRELQPWVLRLQLLQQVLQQVGL
jgi:hypothetical protein